MTHRMRTRRERHADLRELRARYPAPAGESPPWGILDVVDNLWIGNDWGPAVFREYSLAWIAALFANEAAGFDFPGRLLPREYREQSVRRRDEQPLRRTMAQAIGRLETGHALAALRTPANWAR